ncbi:MAG: hypothetical protein ACXWPS_11435, partial [Ktedonobacteraceae bacterium]
YVPTSREVGMYQRNSTNELVVPNEVVWMRCRGACAVRLAYTDDWSWGRLHYPGGLQGHGSRHP